MVRAQAIEVLQFIAQGNDRLRAAIQHGDHGCRQLVGFIDDHMGIAAVDLFGRQRQQFDPMIITNRQLDLARRWANQFLPVQPGLFQQHFLIQRRGSRARPGQVMQLHLAIAATAKAAHGLDAKGDHVPGGQGADIRDGQPFHHLRLLRAPGQLGPVRVPQAPTVAGEVAVENLVGQLAKGHRRVRLSVLDPCPQCPELAFGERQQQRALRVEQARELVNQEGFASPGKALHRHRLVHPGQKLAQQAVLLIAEHEVAGQRRQVHRVQRRDPLPVAVSELEVPLAFVVLKIVCSVVDLG